MIAEASRESLRTAGTLLAFAAAGTALLAFTFALTRPIIARTEEEAKLALIAQVLPGKPYDNDLLRDAVELAPAPELGTSEAGRAYRARLQGRPAAVVLEAVAPDGYSGRIRLLIAIRADGEVAGVRVVAHRETPGLGDYIEAAKSDWIDGFRGRSLDRPPSGEWKVRKDGGQFDYMAGATITPRAVVRAVRQALEYYSQHREQLFAPATGEGR
ncbi:MAG TPA: electron transport complex subunit RsxG [Burkholderiales bacterium]